MKSLDIYHDCVPSSIDSIRFVVGNLIFNLQNSYGQLDDSTLFELKVILNEVLINAIKHGNKEDEKKLVKIRAGIALPDIMFIVIEDEGCGYDFEDICKCNKPFSFSNKPAEINESGRGLMIVRGLCDKVKVNAKGNKIVIVKKISKAHTTF